MGVRLLETFPFPVTISSGDVGGPSAGLMFALGLYELLTPGDMTGGRAIAGTGVIDLEGRVGPISGVRDKVIAAQRAGATVFLAPRGNMGELGGVQTEGMRVVPIRSFADAVAALEGVPGAPG